MGPRLRKVKAHQDLESLNPASEEYELASGNDAADRMAKAAANLGTQPSTAEAEQYLSDTALLKKYLRYVAAALGEWPAIAPRRNKKLAKPTLSLSPPSGAAAASASWDPGAPPVAPPPPPPPPPLPLGPRETPRAHVWAIAKGQRVCTLCRTRVRSLKAWDIKSKTLDCPGHCPQMSALAADPKGHQLYYYEHLEQPTSLLVCHVCGSFKEGNSRGLSGDCVESLPHNGARLQLQRAQSGRHPKSAAASPIVLGPPIPLAQLLRETTRASIEACTRDDLDAGNPSAG